MDDFSKDEILELTAEIVSAYVGRNSLPVVELPGLLQKIHDALAQITDSEAPIKDIPGPLVPAIPIKKSITDDYIVSLENGKKFKSLKRHLMTSYDMTPAQYRSKWGLPPTYPMVAPNCAKSRSALALSLGLGRKAKESAPAPVEDISAPKMAAKKIAPASAVTETATTTAVKPRRGRPAKAA